MPETTVVRTDSWSLALPEGWREPETLENGTVYLDALDRSKGIYITVWTLEPGESRTPEAVAESFKSKDVQALEDMEGYGWRCVEERADRSGDTIVLLADHLAAANEYRIATRIVARLPVVVRAAFHDYLCEDYAASRDYFAPIIESLRLPGV
jgi:hypothetical protein